MKKIVLFVLLSFFISSVSYSQFLGNSVFKNNEKLKNIIILYQVIQLLKVFTSIEFVKDIQMKQEKNFYSLTI